MGKNNRRRLASASTTKRSKPSTKSKPTGISKPTNPSSSTKKKTELTKQQQASLEHALAHPTLPFSSTDKILLIGEGDLSFARALVEHHGCANVTATVYEKSAEELVEKYPHVGETVGFLKDMGGEGEEAGVGEPGLGVGVRYGVDAMKMKPFTEGGRNGRGVMDRVFFNFPHVGGKTKDVNRQVRYNQELLVAFFKNAIPSLSPRHGSSIVVTLFEGEPYTLWNIRDLGRHAGLQVEQSFKFVSSAYPGYRHARTLGVVKGESAWKGEERKARSYVFVRKGEAPPPGNAPVKKKAESSDDEDDNDDDGEGIFEADEMEIPEDDGDEDGSEIEDGHDEEIREDEGFRQG